MAASNFASIKLSSDFIDEARREADVVHRSVGAQVEYWAKLGRAVEATPGFTMERARETLKAHPLDVTTAAEQSSALDALDAAFVAPDPKTTAYYAELGSVEGAVGSDGRGGVIRRQTQPRLRRSA